MHGESTKEGEGKAAARLAVDAGRRVRMARVQLLWTQEQLAQRAGISVSYLSMLERGERVPHLGTLLSLAAALGTGLAALLQDAPARDADAALLEPLAVFVRARKLTPRDVEHLVHVARAVFHEGHR